MRGEKCNMVMLVDGGGGGRVQTYNPPPDPAPASSNTPVQNNAAPPNQTPAERTDAAYAAYQQALAHREQALASAPANGAERAEIRKTEDAAVAKAKQELDAAVADEIGGKVDGANAGVPSQYQRPASELITSYGNDILARHANDPAAQTALKESIGDYQVQRKADDLIPGFYGDFSPQEKLHSLGLSLQGQPPEVVERIMADPRVQQWVKDAAAYIGEPYSKDVGDLSQAHDPALEAVKRLGETTKDLPPELVAQVVKESMPALEKVAQLNPHTNIVPFNAVYSVMSQLGNSPEAQSLMSQVAAEFANNPAYADTGVLTAANGAVYGAAMLSNDHRFAVALADQLRADGKGHQAEIILDQAAKGVSDRLKYDSNSPQVAFENAHKAVEEKDKHLAELLAKAGPLTPEQQAAFIKAFRNDPENAKVYQAEVDAGKQLAEYLTTNKDTLLFAASRDPNAAQQLYTNLQALKDSGQGKTALEFVLEIQSDPNSAVAKAFDQFPDFKTDFTSEAIAAAASQTLVENGGDPNAAFAEFQTFIERYKPDWAAGGVVGLKDGFQAIKLAKEGDYSRLNQITADLNNANPALKGFAAAAIVFGAVNGAKAANQENYALAVNQFASAGQGSARLAASVTKSMADAGKLAAYGDTALNFAGFSSKLAPGLGIVANSAAAASDGAKLFSGKPEYALSFVGDVVSVLGGALELTPAAPIGLIVQGVGALLQIAGSVVTGNAEAEAFQAEQSKYLEAAGISNGDTRNAMINSDPEQIKQLQAMGFTPEQIQELGTLYPQLLESHHGGAPFVGELPKLQQRLGLNGEQMFQLLKAADANGEKGEGLANLMHVMGHPNFFPEVAHAQSKGELIAQFEKIARETSNPEQAKALTQAAQWLRTH
jgi:hypothetical protein